MRRKEKIFPVWTFTLAVFDVNSILRLFCFDKQPRGNKELRKKNQTAFSSVHLNEKEIENEKNKRKKCTTAFRENWKKVTESAKVF